MIKSSKIFERLAIDCPENIEELHNILKAKNIYLWKKGTIESHCELEGKNESIWASFVNRLETEDIDQVLTYKADFEDLIEWMKRA